MKAGPVYSPRLDRLRRLSLRSGIALLFPGVTVSVIAVALPEAGTVVVEEHEAANPLHTFPGVEMRDNKTNRSTVIDGKGLTIVFEGEEDIGTLEVLEGNVGAIAFFGLDEGECGSWFQGDAFQNLGEKDAFPEIVEAAPAGHTVKIAGDFGFGKGMKFLPGKAQGFFDQAGNLEIPPGGIKVRNAASMQDGPFQGE